MSTAKRARTLHGDLNPGKTPKKKHGATRNFRPDTPAPTKLGHLHPGASGPKAEIPMKKATTARAKKPPGGAGAAAAGVAGGSPGIDKKRGRRQGGARG